MRTMNYQYKEPVKPKQIIGLGGKPLSAAYEGSSTGSRLGSWGGNDISPTGTDASELARLRNRSRDMERNTPWTNRAFSVDVANEIGTGIVPKPNTPNKEFNSELKELWGDWQILADAGGVLSAYGLQALAARSRRESGEVFIRIRQRRNSDGLPCPIQFQLIEADYCPASLNQTQPNGNKLKSGIEFNGIGQKVAYWFFRNHPADGGNLTDMVRVPAEQIIHHFIPLRPGQIRGRPVGVQAFVRAYTYDKYDDAELVRKETRAHFTGVIERPDYDDNDYQFDPISGEPIDDDVSVPALNIEPGTFPATLPGEEIKLFEGDQGGSNDMDFARRQLLAISAGYGVPYELLTGDYSKINDRMWRGIMNQYRRELEQAIELYTIQQICRRMWYAFVDSAVLGGVVRVPFDYSKKPFAYKRAEHQPQSWPYIHPLQDIKALQLSKEEGFESRQGIMARRGRDSEQVDKERSEDAKREKELGLSTE
ncbi:MAG: phage portal protein [Pseudomonadota bacterium]|nr:phage portal protein [Pseudomonadota bacterium]